MKLPGAEKAILPIRKLTEYLLSVTHPVGGPKARFFKLHGFDEQRPEILAEALLTIARSEKVREVVLSSHGSKYIIDGYIRTPHGRSVLLRTVWILGKGQEGPRFVTAYPHQEIA